MRNAGSLRGAPQSIGVSALRLEHLNGLIELLLPKVVDRLHDLHLGRDRGVVLWRYAGAGGKGVWERQGGRSRGAGSSKRRRDGSSYGGRWSRGRLVLAVDDRC